MTPATAERALEARVSAVCPVNLWGGTCDIPALDDWARLRPVADLRLSTRLWHRDDRRKARAVRPSQVFSFHATKILTATEGGCVCTDDDELAERIRNMRSNYGIRRPMPVRLTVNARIWRLRQLSPGEPRSNRRAVANNRVIFDTYRSVLETCPRSAARPAKQCQSKRHQYVVIEIDDISSACLETSSGRCFVPEGVRARRYLSPAFTVQCPSTRCTRSTWRHCRSPTGSVTRCCNFLSVLSGRLRMPSASEV